MTYPNLRHILIHTCLAALALAVGCGKKDAPAAGASTEQPAPKAEVGPRPPRWVKVEAPAAKALAYSDHLIMTGDYPRALYLLETIGEKYPEETFPPEVGKTLERLRTIETKDGELTPLLPNLKANNAELLAALKSADNNGFPILRHHVLENKDPELTLAIAKHLVKADDTDAGIAIFALLKQQRCQPAQAQKLAPVLKDIFKKHANTPPYDTAFLEAFAMNLTVEESEAKAAALREALSGWNLKALPPGTLDGYAQALVNDRDYDKIHLMEIMTELYFNQSSQNESLFNGSFSRPQYATCSNYLLRASSDSRNCIKRVVKALGKSFGLPDEEALQADLALHYKLNEPTTAVYVTDSRTKAVRTKLMGQIAARAIVPGLEGNCLQLKGNSILRLSKRSTIKHEVEDRNGKMKMRLKELNMLMNGDYTFAIWINPTKIPTNAESKKNTLSILCREMSPIGLNILRSGGACMIHPATGRPAIAKTAQSIPVGRWTHLAGVVRRKQGAVELFVNGKLAGRASFTPNAPVESVYIRSSHFLVGGISDQRSMEWGSGRDNDTRPAPPRYLNHAFVGKVDEIRLYFRGLDAKEVKQIYDIHAGLAN